MVVERCQPFRIIHYTTMITLRYWVCNSLTRVFSNTPPDRLSSGKIIEDRIDPAGRINLALYIIYETSRQIGLAHQKTPRWEVLCNLTDHFSSLKKSLYFTRWKNALFLRWAGRNFAIYLKYALRCLCAILPSEEILPSIHHFFYFVRQSWQEI